MVIPLFVNIACVRVQYEHHLPEGINDIHLADMAPKYMADKSFGKSLYNTDFDGADVRMCIMIYVH